MKDGDATVHAALELTATREPSPRNTYPGLLGPKVRKRRSLVTIGSHPQLNVSHGT